MDNQALGNPVDLQDDNPNCDANIWQNNEFNTRVAVPPTCIN
jgi:hypothetical protein